MTEVELTGCAAGLGEGYEKASRRSPWNSGMVGTMRDARVEEKGQEAG